MENGTPSSSAPPYTGAGAGGKFRKPPVLRKRPSTPYDRPSLPSTTNKSDHSQADDGGWFNPVRRLIVGGASRLLPSFFSKSDSLSADENDDDTQDLGTSLNTDCDGHSLKLGASWSTGEAGPSNAGDSLKGNTDGQDKSKNLSDDLDLAKIENLVKGKQFSRDELNRLMEILNSRLVDVSNAEGENQALSVIPKGKAEEDLPDPEIPSTSIMGKRQNAEKAVLETPMPRLQSNMQDEVVASPVDIARAYMGSRRSELGLNSYSIVPKGGREPHDDLVSSKPYIATPSSKSSTCWPGAMVQDQRGYLTPQNQRSRFGLHSFPRTPYSRSIYSKTKPRLTQLQAGTSSRSPDISLTPLQQSRTPNNYGQMKSNSNVMDGGYGSVGPIRRVRNNAALPKVANSPYSAQLASSQAEKPSASRSFMPVFQNSPQTARTSGRVNTHSVDRFEQTSKGEAYPTGPSNETIKKILEQLDRHKPTPKEKAAELKLATEWKRSASQDTNLMSKESSIFASSTRFDLSKNVVPSDKRTSVEEVLASFAVTKTSAPVAEDGRVVNEAGVGPSLGFRSLGGSQTRTENEVIATNVNEKATNQLPLLNQTKGQDSARKRPSQPILKPISFKRPDPQQVVSSDNGRGFTFPFSVPASSASEPPTPSIMPSFPAATSAQSATPTYSFGTKKSGQRIVFSFPSTSSAPVDDGAGSDVKFNFGSGKKRVSFGSLGNDAIAIN